MTIEVRDFTGGETAGAGLFDELMRSVNSHLKKEFSDGRLVGADYAQVYLTAISGAMQNASNFVLSMERTNKEIDLIDEQIKQAEKQNELLELQKIKLGIENDTAQFNLDYILPQQLNLLTAQVAQTTAQTGLINEQTSTQQKQQVQLDAQTALTGKQEVLVDEQIKAATYQYTTPTAGLLYAQYEKSMQEVAVLTQKKITEEAQTSGNEGTVSGLIGKEMQLKQNQADSFIRDAEQKAAKLYADAFQVSFSVNPDGGVNTPADPAFWGITGSESSLIFDKLVAGVTE